MRLAVCVVQALGPDGSYLLCGCGRGKLYRYDLERSEGGPASSLAVGSKQELQLRGGGHSEALDCMVSELGWWPMLVVHLWCADIWWQTLKLIVSGQH